jgi:hypothetical protein
MSKNLYTLTLTLLLIGFNYNLNAQDIIDKMSKKLCKCIEKQEVKKPDEMGPCFEELLISNFNEIKEHYNAKTMADLDMETIGNKIGAKMIKECPYVLDNFPTGVVGNEEKVAKQLDLNCDDLKNGDYYYLTKRPDIGTIDTTFVTISNSMFLERMKSGRTYSLLDIKWKDNCEFDLIFKESNDPMKKEVSKPGDVYEYEILTNGTKSFFLKVNWMERTYQFELFKLK